MANLQGEQLGFELEGGGWIGWWFREKRQQKVYWCGFYLNDPAKIGLGVNDPVYSNLKKSLKGKLALEILKRFEWQDYAGEKCGEFFFKVPEKFTHWQAEEQLRFLYDSINEILKFAIGCKVAVN